MSSAMMKMLQKRKQKDRPKSASTVFSANDRGKILNDNTPFAIRETYNSVRAKLMFLARGEKCPVYVVTSANACEGKTTNAINFAVSFAQLGKKTLLIDADMRNPTINRYFGIKRENGLSELLAGIDEGDPICPSPIENLDFLPSGEIPPNPADLLMSPRMASLLDVLRKNYDYIFLDTPPVVMVADATVVAAKVTGYILVVQSEVTDVRDVQYATEAIRQLDGNVVGFFLNETRQGSGRYYNRYNYYSSQRYSYVYQQKDHDN